MKDFRGTKIQIDDKVAYCTRAGYRDGMKDARNEVKPSLNWVSYPGVLLKDDGYKVKKIVKGSKTQRLPNLA